MASSLEKARHHPGGRDPGRAMGAKCLSSSPRTHPQPRRAAYLADAAGRASAWAGSGARMDSDVAGTAPRAASRSGASSLVGSAGKVGGKPSSSTSLTVLPMVNQSFIWSTVSFRSMFPAPFQRRLNRLAEQRELPEAGTGRHEAARTHPAPLQALQSEHASDLRLGLVPRAPPWREACRELGLSAPAPRPGLSRLKRPRVPELPPRCPELM